MSKINKYDVLIVGAGVAGVSCAMMLGSAHNKAFAVDKKVGIITHQKSSSLKNAQLYNVYGVPYGKLGSELLEESLIMLDNYPNIEQLPDQKVQKILKIDTGFQVYTDQEIYQADLVVVAVSAANNLAIEGLETYMAPHPKIAPEKNRIWLVNKDHLVVEGLYAAGVIAGHRSQVAIASGSGAAVATDILTLWNAGIPTQIHDKKEG